MMDFPMFLNKFINNHHKYPSSYDIGLGKRFDLVGWTIRNFLRLEDG